MREALAKRIIKAIMQLKGGSLTETLAAPASGKRLARQLLLFVIPIWLGVFFQQLYNMADAVFVGRYVGKEALAAVGGPTGQVVSLLIGVFVELSAGASVIIAQYFGAENPEKTRESIHTAAALALICGLVITLAGFVFTPMLLRGMKAEGEVFELSLAYLRIYFGGTVFITAYNMGSSILRAIGDSKRPFYFLLVGCLTNIVLDYILIVWLRMGVAGAAIATVFSQALSALLILRALMRLPEEYRLNLREIGLRLGIFKRMMSIGVPESMQQVLYSTSNILIQANIDSYGTDSIAAMSAYSKADILLWMTLESFGIAITALTGRLYGAGDVKGIKKMVKICLWMIFGIALVLAALMLVAAPLLMRLFTDDTEVIRIGIQVQRLLVPTFILFIPVLILGGALRGMGHALVPMVITFVGICLVRLIWIYTVVPLKPELMTTITSYPITWGLTSLAFLIYYRRTIRREESGLKAR